MPASLPRLLIFAERPAAAREFGELARRIQGFEVVLLLAKSELALACGELPPHAEIEVLSRPAGEKKQLTVLERVARVGARAVRHMVGKVWDRVRKFVGNLQWESLITLREYQKTKRNLERDIAAAENVLNVLAPDVIIVGDDRPFGFVQALGLVARNRDIPQLCAQYAITRAQGGTFIRRERRRFHVDRGLLSPLKRRIVAECPQELQEYNGRRLMFHTPGVYYALKYHGITFPQPWAFSGGLSQIGLMIDDTELQSAIEAGADPAKYVITGQASHDVIRDGLRQRTQLREQLAESYGLPADKPLAIFAVPQYAEHKMMDWQTHLDDLNRVFSVLSKSGCPVGLSLHPRAETERYIPLAEQHGLPIIKETLATVIAGADVFLSTYSSTVNWAIMLGTEIIIVDTHKLNLDHFSDRPMRICHEYGDLSTAIDEALAAQEERQTRAGDTPIEETRSASERISEVIHSVLNARSSGSNGSPVSDGIAATAASAQTPDQASAASEEKKRLVAAHQAPLAPGNVGTEPLSPTA